MPTNDDIRKILGTAPVGSSGSDQAAAPSDEASAPLQAIATNGSLLIQNLSSLSTLIGGWR